MDTRLTQFQDEFRSVVYGNPALARSCANSSNRITRNLRWRKRARHRHPPTTPGPPQAAPISSPGVRAGPQNASRVIANCHRCVRRSISVRAPRGDSSLFLQPTGLPVNFTSFTTDRITSVTTFQPPISLPLCVYVFLNFVYPDTINRESRLRDPLYYSRLPRVHPLAIPL